MKTNISEWKMPDMKKHRDPIRIAVLFYRLKKVKTARTGGYKTLTAPDGRKCAEACRRTHGQIREKARPGGAGAPAGDWEIRRAENAKALQIGTGRACRGGRTGIPAQRAGAYRL